MTISPQTVSPSTQLFIAIANDDVDEVKRILKSHPEAARSVFDLRDRGLIPKTVEKYHLTQGTETPLSFVVGYTIYPSELLSVLVPYSDLSYKDKDGKSLLFLARPRLSTHNFSVLVSAASDEALKACTRDHLNVLMHACQFGDTEKVKVLLEDGRLDARQRRAKDNQGPLEFAIQRNSRGCVELLLKNRPELAADLNQWVEQELSLVVERGEDPSPQSSSFRKFSVFSKQKEAEELASTLETVGDWVGGALLLRAAEHVEAVLGDLDRMSNLKDRVLALREQSALRLLLTESAELGTPTVCTSALMANNQDPVVKRKNRL